MNMGFSKIRNGVLELCHVTPFDMYGMPCHIVTYSWTSRSPSLLHKYVTSNLHTFWLLSGSVTSNYIMAPAKGNKRSKWLLYREPLYSTEWLTPYCIQYATNLEFPWPPKPILPPCGSTHLLFMTQLDLDTGLLHSKIPNVLRVDAWTYIPPWFGCLFQNTFCKMSLLNIEIFSRRARDRCVGFFCIDPLNICIPN